MTNNQINKISFFSDRPLSADKEQEVRFGHLGVINNLKEILFNCPIPFTVGLFGKWGSGKSTIINILSKKLEESNIATIDFDVWKHEGDSLRRDFLEELVNQSKSKKYLPDSFTLNERLKTPIQKTKKGEIIFNREVAARAILLILIIVDIGLFLYNKYPGALGNYLSIIFGGSVISGLFLALLKQTVILETITTVLEPFKDPYEFEEEFLRIIKAISQKKIVIFIDNLDRCIHNKAIEVLSTIKTFLAKDADVVDDNKCIFLIACDDEAIKKHLESVYVNNQDKNSSTEPFSADEFLRKFFNVFLRIPDFIDTELQSYTEELLRQTKIPQFTSLDLAFVITNAFRENPRQIKQFINILLAHFLLAQDRETSKPPLIIPSGIITDNVVFLAKILIIRQLFPQEYQKIREDSLTTKEMEDIGTIKFKDFLRATKPVTVEDIRPFIYFKQSEEEREIPGIKELVLGLTDDKLDMIKDKLKDIKTNSEQLSSLKIFMPHFIDRNKNRRIPVLNIISCSLEAFRHHNIEMGLDYYTKIADLLNNNPELKSELQRFEPNLIFKGVLEKCRNAEDRVGIINQYINILQRQEDGESEAKISINFAYNLFKELLEHEEWIVDKKGKINKILESTYYASPRVLSLFKGKIENKKDFISENTISKFAATFSNDDIENMPSIKDKVELLLNFREIITPKVTQKIIESLQNLLNTEIQKPFRGEKENFLDCIGKVVNVLKEQIKSIQPRDPLNAFANILVQGFNALGDWNQRKMFIFTFINIIDIVDNPYQTNINNLSQKFFINVDVSGIDFVFLRLNEERKMETIEKYIGVFQPRVMQQQPVFDLLYPLTSSEIRTQWLADLITSAYPRALAKLEELKYEVDNRQKVVGALLATVQSAALQDKIKIYEIINKLKCADDSDLKNNLITQIKSLLKNSDNNQQQVGYSSLQGAIVYLSATSVREIIREVVEWLRALEPVNAGKTYAIRSVILNWEILEKPLQDDYIDFIFDKLIKRAINIDNIRFGFEILIEIKPQYDAYTVYFDDVLAKAETDVDNQIKSEIRGGLLKLKPPKLSEKNSEFWNKVEKIAIKTE